MATCAGPDPEVKCVNPSQFLGYGDGGHYIADLKYGFQEKLEELLANPEGKEILAEVYKKSLVGALDQPNSKESAAWMGLANVIFEFADNFHSSGSLLHKGFQAWYPPKGSKTATISDIESMQTSLLVDIAILKRQPVPDFQTISTLASAIHGLAICGERNGLGPSPIDGRLEREILYSVMDRVKDKCRLQTSGPIDETSEDFAKIEKTALDETNLDVLLDNRPDIAFEIISAHLKHLDPEFLTEIVKNGVINKIESFVQKNYWDSFRMHETEKRTQLTKLALLGSQFNKVAAAENDLAQVDSTIYKSNQSDDKNDLLKNRELPKARLEVLNNEFERELGTPVKPAYDSFLIEFNRAYKFIRYSASGDELKGYRVVADYISPINQQRYVLTFQTNVKNGDAKNTLVSLTVNGESQPIAEDDSSPGH